MAYIHDWVSDLIGRTCFNWTRST